MNIRPKTIHDFYYFLWGSASSFALLAENPVVVQMLAPVPILLFWIYKDESKLVTIFISRKIGFLIYLSTLIVGISAFLNGFTVNGLIRFLALIPAFSILLMTCEDKDYLNGALRAFAASSFFFVLTHLALTDWSEILNPKYRLELFLNTNGVAFIACMCALVHIVLLAQPGKIKSKTMTFLDVTAVFAGIMVLFLTRSRTATAAFIGGAACLPFVIPGFVSKRIGWLLFFASFVIVLSVSYWPSIFEFLSNNFSFFDQYRGVETATNRTEIWTYTFHEIILKNLFFGIGPGNYLDAIERGTGYTNANNGLFVYMAEIGLLGTIPYVLLLISTFIKTFKSKGLMRLFLAFLVAGFIESLGETMFFSTGSVASLIFLLVVAAENSGRNTTDES